ncbi:antitoxin, partial [Enterococcus faecalis]|nr:antitoxin [Enterococcus faecalis]EGO6029366.1 antitoxin [Enterococcus faecalis]
MKQFMVRNIPEKTIAGIDDLAKQNGQSREGYIRDLLN